MRVLSLFAGIGGFDLAATWAGMEIAGQVEIDGWCRRVLAKHWPGVPKAGDIRGVRGDEFGPVDVVAGGFPCQPFSHAGKRRGSDDDRHLWPEMLRVIKVARPTWVLGENVTGFVGMALDGVSADLEAEGYEVRAFVLPACGVQALHRRDRVWVVARCVADALGGGRDRVAHGAGGDQSDRAAAGRQEGADRVADGGADVADADGAGWGEHGRAVAVPAPLAAAFSGSEWRGARHEAQPRIRHGADGLSQLLVQRPAAGPARLMDPRWEGDPLNAFGHGWEYAAPLVTAEKVPDRVAKLKGLGNAVVPQVCYLIFKAIIEAEEMGDAEGNTAHEGIGGNCR